MHKYALELVSLLLAAGMTTGCAVDIDDAPDPIEPTVDTEGMASSGLVTSVSWRNGRFSVDVRVPGSVVISSGYLVTSLSYLPADAGVSPVAGAGVSPFAAPRISDVDFTRVGTNRYTATVIVDGPEPRNIDDVQGWVLANPTPYP